LQNENSYVGDKKQRSGTAPLPVGRTGQVPEQRAKACLPQIGPVSCQPDSRAHGERCEIDCPMTETANPTGLPARRGVPAGLTQGGTEQRDEEPLSVLASSSGAQIRTPVTQSMRFLIATSSY